ncbi:RICIN domain-containing protein [Streptomyces sp. NPDC048337]|uniref:RICIN domain-containing protein n=1 Tax=Streptomyces sp. NPDC048337 TaxID=3365535 RepID=UPI003712D619
MQFARASLVAAGVAALALPFLAVPVAHAGPAGASAAVFNVIVSDLNPDQVLDDGRGYALSHYRHDGLNQQWELIDMTDDTFQIKARTGACATAPTSHGAVLTQPCERKNLAQHWYVNRHGSKTVFENLREEGQCLTKAADQEPTVVTDCNGAKAQNWRLTAPQLR